MQPLIERLEELAKGVVIVSGAARHEQIDGAVDDALGAIYPPDERGRIANLFEETAYVWWQSGREDDARQALAAAADFRTCEPRDNPVARAMIERLLSPALARARAESDTRSRWRTQMRRRFGRGRRNESEGGGRGAPIDPAQAIAQIVAARAVDAERLEPVPLRRGVRDVRRARRRRERVGPARGGRLQPDARRRRGARGARATARPGAPRASPRRACSRWRPTGPAPIAVGSRCLTPRLPLTAIAASALAPGGVRIAPEPREPAVVEPALLAGRLDRASDREAFVRALAGLEGLAAKHGGVLRGGSDRAELVLLARRVATLVAEPGGVRLEVLDPERATLPLSSAESLATALDRLEGSLRKLLNDRKIRTGEAGLRAALQPVLERAVELVASARWPVGGVEGEPIESVGLDAPGRVVVAAAREKLDLPALAEILDAVPAAIAAARDLARRAGRPPGPGAPRLALAAVEFERAVLDAFAALGTDLTLFDARTRRSGDWALEPRPRPELGAAAAGGFAPPPAFARESAPAPTPSYAEPTPAPRAFTPEPTPAEPAVAPRRFEPREPDAGPEPARAEARAEARPEIARFEEVSLFDLDEDVPDAPAGEIGTEGEGPAVGAVAAAAGDAAGAVAEAKVSAAIGRAATTAAVAASPTAPARRQLRHPLAPARPSNPRRATTTMR